LKRSAKDLVGYCGLYCGVCGIRQGRIKQAVENLRKIIKFYGFDEVASDMARYETSFQHYPEFEKVMDGFVKLLGECPGCVAGGGDPNCAIRKCCRQRGYATCTECAEIDACEKVKQYLVAGKGLRKIQEIGVERWAEEMQKLADSGYCHLDGPIE